MALGIVSLFAQLLGYRSARVSLRKQLGVKFNHPNHNSIRATVDRSEVLLTDSNYKLSMISIIMIVGPIAHFLM